MPRHSKLQIQVLSLYKKFLQTSRDKPGVAEYVKSEFRKNATIPRTDTLRIEHIFRRAERQLETLKNSSFQGVGVFKKQDHQK